MNVVLLSPHFPAQMTHYARQLAHLGVNVIGLGDEPQSQLSPALRSVLTEYIYVSDMHQYPELLRACGLITWHYGKIDRIDSLNEYWLETEAALRTDFNVPGIKNDSIRQVKAKSEMKRVFQAHNIPCAAGQVVHSLNEALALAKKLGYPVVLKPDIGVGASDTWRADHEESLTSIFQHKPDKSFILEPFVKGKIFTFDGIADRAGNPVFTSSMTYSEGVMEVVNRDDHIYFYTLRKIPSDLEALGRKMLKAFDVRERFFHFEFFRKPDGQLLALEVNMRPPGGPAVDMMNYAHDIDLYREWANVLVHNHFNAAVNCNWFCAYAGRKQHKVYRHDYQDIISRYGHTMVDHGALPMVFRKAMGDEYYLYRCANEADVIEIARFIQA